MGALSILVISSYADKEECDKNLVEIVKECVRTVQDKGKPEIKVFHKVVDDSVAASETTDCMSDEMILAGEKAGICITKSFWTCYYMSKSFDERSWPSLRGDFMIRKERNPEEQLLKETKAGADVFSMREGEVADRETAELWSYPLEKSKDILKHNLMKLMKTELYKYKCC